MSESLVAFRGSYDRVTIPTIWIAVFISLLLHAAALLGWFPHLLHMPFEDLRLGKPQGSLSVRLSLPPSRPAPAVPPASEEQVPASRTEAHRHKAPPRPRVPAPGSGKAAPAPRVLALEQPAQPPQPAVPPPAEAARVPAAADFASFVAARRRARDPEAESAARAAPPQAPVETEQARHNRIVAENLGLTRTPSFGADRLPGGGVFQIERLNYLDAEFDFYGWNKNIKRNSRQVIEVQRGSNPSIELAVIRGMIKVIRDTVSGDFQWESPRLGHDVTLSARVEDNAELEDFLMREFFYQNSR